MTEIIKKEIESRYKRIKEGRRRPSMEYLNNDEIKEIFSGYVKDKETFYNFTDEEFEEFFDLWYEKHGKMVLEDKKKYRKETLKKELRNIGENIEESMKETRTCLWLENPDGPVLSPPEL